MNQPILPLQPGENYRFHFDATKCVGCKCCEVACHEQNNNPADVKWRRVGEVEGGEFPDTKRFYISMSCNHCQDPACMTGCPVDAYYKEANTGFVLMKDDACIGCQYCTWNCPYGAPQYNEERGMVTKCDMCHNRIGDGHAPACVAACPSQALVIERFSLAEAAEREEDTNAPGVPEASITRSTTRITFPSDGRTAFNRIDEHRIKPQHPHVSLILLTVLTQLSVGGFVCLFVLEGLPQLFNLNLSFPSFLKTAHLTMLGTACVALNASFFHLGRPLYAFRAMKMWRRSWLSREVVFFTLFAGGAILYSIVGWQNMYAVPRLFQGALGALVASTGLMGVYCSAMIYRVPARPSWDTIRTPIAFFATAFILGPLLTLVVLTLSIQGNSIFWQSDFPTLNSVVIFLVSLMLMAGFVQLAGIIVKLLNSFSKNQPERQHSARMLTQRFRNLFLARLGVLLLALLLVPIMLFTQLSRAELHTVDLSLLLAILLILTLFSEFSGRYLFFVTVVPKKRPEGFF